MKYKKLSTMNWESSILGFGCMRLPTITEGHSRKYNESESIEIIRYGIDHGINYIDTAWPYCDQLSEVIVGKALQEGYREKVRLVTKLPMYLMKKEEDFTYFLSNQLKKLQTDYIDIYLLHALNKTYFENVKKWKILDKMEKAREEGLIKYIGFSFHDDFETFKIIVDHYNWDVVQIQYNYVDTEIQATQKGLEYAASKNLPVIIMEPIKGGSLATNNKETSKILEKTSRFSSLPDIALKFVWNHPGVSVVLSGMGSLQMVKENIKSAIESEPNSFTEEDMVIIKKLKSRFGKKSLVTCTGCKYCMPCPSDVLIPQNFQIINDYHWDMNLEQTQNLYFALGKSSNSEERKNANATECTECGQCLQLCPQSINIPKMLQNMTKIIENGTQIPDLFNLQVHGPEIKEKDAFEIVGIEIPDAEDEQAMREVWPKFFQVEANIPQRKVGYTLAVILPTPNSEKKRYIPSKEVFKVENIPADTISEKIPKYKWAIFTHIGPISKFDDTLKYINEQWFPNNLNFKKVENGPMIEYYDQRYSSTSDNCEMELHIAVEPK